MLPVCAAVVNVLHPRPAVCLRPRNPGNSALLVAHAGKPSCTRTCPQVTPMSMSIELNVDVLSFRDRSTQTCFDVNLNDDVDVHPDLRT